MKDSLYCSIKDKITYGQKHHVIYQLKCPENNGKCIGKTERCMILLMNEYDQRHCIKKLISHREFFSKCDQICRKLRIWSYLLKKSLRENFLFCAVCMTEPTFNPCQANIAPNKAAHV